MNVNNTRFGAATAALSLSLAAASASANPSGASVVAGQVDFSLVDPKVLEITNSPDSIINWRSFSIGRDEITRFIQQGASSRVLNRVTGGDLSAILGQLQSNGQVYLINPNGIFFGPDAVVDVAGLVASTLNLSDEDFLQGNFRFLEAGDGAIVNAGTLQALDDILLIASDIENAGAIYSEQGNVLLAAGESVLAIDPEILEVEFELQAPDNEAVNLGEVYADNVGIFGGTIEQQGGIRVDSVSVDDAGRVVLHAADTAWVGGTVSASSAGGSGGEIDLLGHNVGLVAGALVAADGATGGGTVHIGGSREGQGPLPNANAVYIDAGATVRADATVDGDGGTVIAYADDVARIHGAISARGASEGAGGFVETSGRQHLDITATPDISADNGDAGTWLIDPFNLVISSTSANTTTSPGAGVFESDDSPFSEIGVDVIEQALDGNATVILQTGAGGADQGDIVWQFNAQLDLGNTTGNNILELRAHNNIELQGGATPLITFATPSAGQELIFRTYPNFDGGGGGTITASGVYDFGTDGTGSPGGWDATSVGINSNLIRFNGNTNITGDFSADIMSFLNAPTVTMSRGGSVDTFNFSNGSYDNPIGSLVPTVAFNWSGGTILGDIRPASSSTVTISSGATAKVIDGGFLWSQAAGTDGNGEPLSKWNAAGSADTVTLQNGGDFHISGFFSIGGGATLATDGNTGNQFVNRGSLYVLAHGLDPVTLQADYIDTFAPSMFVDGEVIIEDGRLTSFGSGHTTAFQQRALGTSSTIRFRNTHTFDTFDSSFSGIDSLIFEDATASLSFLAAAFDVAELSIIGNSSVTLFNDHSFSNLVLQSSAGNNPIFDRRGTVDVLNAFTWDAGTITGTGALVIDAGTGFDALSVVGDRDLQGGSLTVPNLSLQAGILAVDGGDLVVNGNLSTAAGTVFAMSSGSVAVASGTFTVASNSTNVLGGSINAANLTLATGGRFDLSTGGATVTNTLTVGGNSDFNWTNGTLTADTIQINSNGRFTVTPAANLTLDGSTINNQGTFTHAGAGSLRTTMFHQFNNFKTLQLDGQRLDITNGGLSQSAGGSLVMNGGTLIGSAITLSGSLTGFGQMAVSLVGDGLTISPGIASGDPTGKLTISTGLTLIKGSTLELEIGGTVQGTDYDWLEVGGTFSIDNAVANNIVDVALINAFTPGGSDSFQPVTASFISGTFGTENIASGLSAAVYNSGDITLNAAVALALNSWTGLGGDLDWHNAANWDQGLPDSTHDVEIDINGTVSFGSALDDTIKTLTLSATTTLALTAGSLTITDDSVMDGILTLNGGALNINGASSVFRLNHTLGALGGTGALTVTNIWAPNIGAPVNGQLILGPSITHVLAGGLTLSGTGTLTNQGSLTITGNTVFDTNLANDGGTFDLQNGTTSVAGAYTQTGTATSSLSGGDLQVAGAFALNQGVLNIGSGMLSLGSTFSMAGTSTLNLSGGTLDFGEGNEPTLPSGSVMNITGGTLQFTAGGLSERLFNEGTINFTDGNINAPGGFVTRNGGLFTISSSVNNSISSTSGQISASTSGIIRKLADGSGTTTLNMRMGLSNGGSFELLGGTLDASFRGIFAQQANTRINLAGGDLIVGVNDSATLDYLRIINGAELFGGSTALTGDVISEGATIHAGNSPGDFTINGTLDLDAASTLAVEIFGATQGTQFDHFTVDSLVVNGATMTADFGSFTPAAGTQFAVIDFSLLSGSGFGTFTPTLGSATLNQVGSQFIVSAGALSALQITSPTTWSGDLNFAQGIELTSTIDWTGGNITISGDLVLKSGSEFRINNTSGLAQTLTADALIIDANATLELLATSTTLATISAPVTVSGKLNTAGGLLDFSQALKVASGGVMSLAGSTLNMNGTFENLGSFSQLSGTTTLAGASNANKSTATVSGGTLTVSGAALTNTGTFNVSGGTTNFGTQYVQSAGLTRISGGIVNAGTFAINGGTFKMKDATLNGNLDFSGGNATFSPGLSPGRTIIGGNLVLGPNSNTLIEILGTSPETQYDVIDVSGTTALDGKLTFSFGTFLPASSSVFTFLSSNGGFSGNFAAINNAGGGVLNFGNVGGIDNLSISGIQLAALTSTSALTTTSTNQVLTNNPQPSSSNEPIGTETFAVEQPVDTTESGTTGTSSSADTAGGTSEDEQAADEQPAADAGSSGSTLTGASGGDREMQICL